MALTLGVTLLVAYYDRLNISLAIPLIALEQGWTPEQIADNGGLLMGLFYAGYGVANILFSPLGARIGPRRSLVIIILLWSLFTALGAVVSQFLLLFMASRVLLGLSEGIHFPMMSLLTRTWFAPHERSRANGIWIAGLFLAVLTAPILLVPVMDAHGWRSGFHLLAIAGMAVSLPLVFRYVYDRPQSHPRVGSGVAAALVQAAGPEAASGAPGMALSRSPVFLLLMLAGILNNMVALGIAGWLPTYLGGLEGVVYGDLAHLAAIPYAASLAGIATWALLGDRLNRRALLAGVGYLAAGLAVVAALRAGSAGRVGLSVGLFSLGVFCVAAYTASEFALLQRILPVVRVATGVGIYNGLTTMLGGGLGPYVVGGIITGGAQPFDFALLFGLCAAITTLMFAVARRLRY
jgi:MFS family permease